MKTSSKNPTGLAYFETDNQCAQVLSFYRSGAQVFEQQHLPESATLNLGLVPRRVLIGSELKEILPVKAIRKTFANLLGGEARNEKRIYFAGTLSGMNLGYRGSHPYWICVATTGRIARAALISAKTGGVLLACQFPASLLPRGHLWAVPSWLKLVVAAALLLLSIWAGGLWIAGGILAAAILIMLYIKEQMKVPPAGAGGGGGGVGPGGIQNPIDKWIERAQKIKEALDKKAEATDKMSKADPDWEEAQRLINEMNRIIEDEKAKGNLKEEDEEKAKKEIEKLKKKLDDVPVES